MGKAGTDQPELASLFSARVDMPADLNRSTASDSSDHLSLALSHVTLALPYALALCPLSERLFYFRLSLLSSLIAFVCLWVILSFGFAFPVIVL